MVMKIPTKTLLIIKGTSSRAAVPGAKNIQAMQEVLSGLPVMMDCAQNEITHVQYSPSPLSIWAHVQSIKVNSMQKPGETVGVRQEEEPPSTEFSVKLVFTAMNSKDAFMTDEFRLSVGDTVSDGAAIAKVVNGGYTAHSQIDRLMGVIMDMDTRGVAFVWQGMMLGGQVSSLRNPYNMPNMSGDPISGSIDISITQNISEVSVTAWDKALDKRFALGVAGKSPLEKAGNLINLNL